MLVLYIAVHTMRVKDTYYIGDLASQLNLSQRTIRYYEELGIIKPMRSDGGFRVYSSRDLEVIRAVIHLKELGMNLEDISGIIKANAGAHSDKLLQHMISTLLAKKSEIETKIETYKNGLTQISAVLEFLSKCTRCGGPIDDGICEHCLSKLKKNGGNVAPIVSHLVEIRHHK